MKIQARGEEEVEQTGEGCFLHYKMHLSRSLVQSAGYYAHTEATIGSSGVGKSLVLMPRVSAYTCL